MNKCVYCDNKAKRKICGNRLCKNKYKQQHYKDNIDHYRKIKKDERIRNFENRKPQVYKNARNRYYSDDLKYIVSNMFQNSKARAAKYSLEYDLDKSFIHNLFNIQNNKCALTNLPFIYEIKNNSKSHKRPFAASLDRIDSNLGYLKSNVRLVCIIVNFALSEFDDIDFDKMCFSYVENKKDK